MIIGNDKSSKFWLIIYFGPFTFYRIAFIQMNNIIRVWSSLNMVCMRKMNGMDGDWFTLFMVRLQTGVQNEGNQPLFMTIYLSQFMREHQLNNIFQIDVRWNRVSCAWICIQFRNFIHSNELFRNGHYKFAWMINKRVKVSVNNIACMRWMKIHILMFFWSKVKMFRCESLMVLHLLIELLPKEIIIAEAFRKWFCWYKKEETTVAQ